MKYYILKIQSLHVHPTVWRVNGHEVTRLRSNKWDTSMYQSDFVKINEDFQEVTKEQVKQWYPKAEVL